MVELGESKVPLTKDIINREQTFTQTYFEFIIREGIQIIREGTTSDTSIYTVPTNKIFYLYHMNFNVAISSPVSTTNPSGWQFTEGGNSFQLCNVNGLLIDGMGSNSLNPALPIRFNEGVVFGLNVGANTTSSGMMFGIEVDKELAFRR